MFNRSQSSYIECDNSNNYVLILVILFFLYLTTTSSNVQTFVGFNKGRKYNSIRLPNSRLNQFSQKSEKIGIDATADSLIQQQIKL